LGLRRRDGAADRTGADDRDREGVGHGIPLPSSVGFGDMLVQIYEVQTPEEAAALARLGVDHLGVLVGDGAFPRELSIDQTNAIFATVPAGTKRVALSLSTDLEEVARVVQETRPDIIQVQAAIEDFSVAMTRALKTRFPQIPIMRAIPVIDQTSIETAALYQGAADFLLLDSWDPGTGQFGALGRVHDWRLSRRIVEDVGIPVILAGGLGPENVAEAIAVVRPAGVDSKTRTDRLDGSGKDLAKVASFVATAKLTR
jgi:phosphoribosylanthranilate isomerase